MHFKGSRNCSKYLILFALPTKENSVVLYISRGKVLAPYRKIGMLKLPHVLFWIVQNFRAFSRPFRATVEKSYLYQFGVEWSQLFKTVRNLKIGWTLAIWATLLKVVVVLLKIQSRYYSKTFRIFSHTKYSLLVVYLNKVVIKIYFFDFLLGKWCISDTMLCLVTVSARIQPHSWIQPQPFSKVLWLWL